MLNSVTQHLQRNWNLKALGVKALAGLWDCREAGRLHAGGAGHPPWLLLVFLVELMQLAKLEFSHGNAAGSEAEMGGRADRAASLRKRELLMYSSSLILLSKVSCGQRGQVLLCRGRNYDKMYTQHQTCITAWVSSCLLFLGSLSYLFVLPSSFSHSQSSSPLKRTQRISKTAVTVMRGIQSGTIMIILFFIVFIYIV